MACHIHSIYVVYILTMSLYGCSSFLTVDNIVVIVIDSSFVEQIEKPATWLQGYYYIYICLCSLCLYNHAIFYFLLDN